jgi:16S rRNA (cytosine1402-N4)-methyltransferase
MQWLAPQRGGLFVDGTLGLGGHSEAMLEASPQTRVIGIDRDTQAIERAKARLSARFGLRFQAVHANFFELAQVLAEHDESGVNGVLVDLGVSSLQLDTPERGFSFRHEAPLDMRMDASRESQDESLADYLATVDETELARVIYEYGEERKSRRIARWIIEKREQGEPIKTTTELAALVARAVGHKSGARGERIHPATRTFQALRIAVNRELDGLKEFIETAVDLLQPDGRFVAISFHSLEDRIVKQTLRRLSGRCECDLRAPVCSCGARRAVEILTPRPVTATPAEIEANPRSRSAKLRACVKLAAVNASI